MGVEEHREKAEKYRNLKFSVITVSDTKGPEQDESGKIIIKEMEKEGHKLAKYLICKDDVEEIRKALEEALGEADFVILNGGTGISRRDVTVEAIKPLLEKEVPGFGELFRYLSYEEIGPDAILSRAFAGIIKRKPVFCLPGSKNAVSLAVKRIISKVISHMIYEVRR